MEQSMNAIASLPLLARFNLTRMMGAQSPPSARRKPVSLSGERLARARLARTPRVGPVTFHEMLGHFGSATAALEALPGLAQRAGFAQAPEPPAADALQREAEMLARLGGRFVIHGDPDYPQRVAQIPDAPPLLSALGDLDLLARPALAVVGARNASTNGRRVAATVAGDLGAAGFVIVSGLARGIDTAAHRAALDTGTVAVLAGGVDVIYPPENEDLYREITARGLVLSEAPLGAVPQARHFPRRNRIVSGLSQGVLVIEAALQSGSLITARQAADQGREVFAVPGSPLDPRCRGSNRLIRDGAQLVEEAADVLAVLPPAAPGPRAVAAGAPVSAPPRLALHDGAAPATTLALHESPAPAVRRAFEPPMPPAVTESNGPATSPDAPPARLAKACDAASQPVEEERDSVCKRLLDCLGRSPTPVDELIRECHVSPALVTAALLDLELTGRVERLQGNMVALV
jgi:DNA processing protein